jgi:hypothetical protein
MNKTMEIKDLKKVIDFKWRVQSANQYGASCVAYIDSRQVQDLLDDVCGIENWQSRFIDVKGNLFCEIGIKINNEWIWKSDCGVESNIEKEKGESSDSFKRAAVMWGVGRFLYSQKIVKLPTKEDGKDYKGNPKYSPFSEKTGKFVKDAKSITAWCNQLNK